MNRVYAGLRSLVVCSLPAVTALALAAPLAPPLAAQTAGDAPLTVRASALLQLRFFGTSVEDESETGTFVIPRARFALSGTAYEDFAYAVQFDLQSGTVVDANLRYVLAPIATLWMGRGKAPFGRQQLTSGSALHFVDRTIVNQRFAAGRHQGVGVMGQSAGESFEYQAGIYNGRGPLSAPGNPFLKIGRVVWTPFGSYGLAEGAHDYPDTPRLALGVSGMSAPEAGPDESDLRRMNVEVAYKVRGVNMTGELYREWQDPQPDAAPVVTTDGFYYQMGYLFPNRMHELAGRLAFIDTRDAEEQINEFGVAHSYYLQGHSLKIQNDLRYLTDERDVIPDRYEFRSQLQLAF